MDMAFEVGNSKDGNQAKASLVSHQFKLVNERVHSKDERKNDGERLKELLISNVDQI